MDLTSASVTADSENVLGNRLITVSMTYPAVVHDYVMAHTSFARSSNDIRCMTPGSLQQQVRDSGFIPEKWRRAAPKGSIPRGTLNAGAADHAEGIWRAAMSSALAYAKLLESSSVARELTNRLLTPFVWLKTVATADYENWCNFLSVRTRSSEQAEIRSLALAVERAIEESTPTLLIKGEWHIPFGGDDPDPLTRIKRSVATAARLSYRTPRVYGYSEDESAEGNEKLFLRLQRLADWSHFEHQALCWLPSTYSNDDDEAVPSKLRGKFADGWVQFRKTVSGEVFKSYKFRGTASKRPVERESGSASWVGFAEELVKAIEKAIGGA